MDPFHNIFPIMNLEVLFSQKFNWQFSIQKPSKVSKSYISETYIFPRSGETLAEYATFSAKGRTRVGAETAPRRKPPLCFCFA